MKTYIIVPNCDDTNRGDQALIWETVRLARESGYDGQFYMLAEKEKSRQSEAECIGQMDAILPHPSVHFKNKNNIRYGFVLKLKWAAASLIDAANALLLTRSSYRKLFLRFYPENIRRTIDIFRNADAAFVKGGGFLHTYGGIINTYQNFYDLYHIILALSFKKPVYFMPNSFGPFLSPMSGKLVKSVLSRCQLVCTRESVSQKVLEEEISLSAMLMPDLAFFLDKNECITPEQEARLASIPFGQNSVAITVRPYRFPGSVDPEKMYDGYKKAICTTIQYLAGSGYHPVLIEHTFSDNQHEQDMSCIRDIQNMLGNFSDYSIYSDLSMNCRQLKYVYSKFRYIIGTRFHSVIFSLASGVPAVAIGYGGNKGRGIMNDIDLSEYAIPIENICADTIINTFQLMVQNEEEYKGKISVYLKTAEDRKRELIECLKIAKKR